VTDERATLYILLVLSSTIYTKLDELTLLFQPAYSPEVNPIERLWGYVKEQLKWLKFDQIEDLRAAVQKELDKLTLEVIASLTGWEFILEALSVAEL
jgi:putative transposase